MSRRYDLWIILSEKTGKDERLHFLFTTMTDTSDFLLDWMKFNTDSSIKVILEMTNE
jgi:hypothetical protein